MKPSIQIHNPDKLSVAFLLAHKETSPIVLPDYNTPLKKFTDIHTHGPTISKEGYQYKIIESSFIIYN